MNGFEGKEFDFSEAIRPIITVDEFVKLDTFRPIYISFQFVMYDFLENILNPLKVTVCKIVG